MYLYIFTFICECIISTCICTCIGIGDIVGNNFVRTFVSAAVLQSQELGQELVEMVDSLADTLLLNMVAGEPSQEVYGLAVSDSDSVPLNRLNAFVYGSQVSSATGPSIILTLQRVRDAASLVSEPSRCVVCAARRLLTCQPRALR
jgi:hypothetical protein